MPLESPSRMVRRLAFGALGMVVLIGFGILLYRIFSGVSAVPRKNVPDVVTLRLIQPPPPPPPPPPKMAEPPKLKTTAAMLDKPMDERPPAPKQAAEKPPEGPPALDVKGQGPGDEFALAGRPGGSDFLGGGGGGGGSRLGWYRALIEGRVQDAVQKQRRLSGTRYRVDVQMWLTGEGSPAQVELITSTGSADLDKALLAAIRAMPPLPEPPPKEMQQPVVFQVKSL